MQASPIRRLVPYITAAKQKGKKVYHLHIGQPDIKTPQGFFDAIKNFNAVFLSFTNFILYTSFINK